MKNIVLVGFMGSGKTLVGKMLAEEMKMEYGDVTPGMSEDIKDKHEGLMEKRAIFYEDIHDILTARMTETFELILKEIPCTDCAAMFPAGLVLTGGTANLPGLAALGEQILGVPVRIGVPKGMYGIGGLLSDSTYATAAGLLLWESRYEKRPKRGELVLPVREGISKAWEARFKETTEREGGWLGWIKMYGVKIKDALARLFPIRIGRAPRQ